MTIPQAASIDLVESETKVKEMYRAVAENPVGSYHFQLGRELAEDLGYPIVHRGVHRGSCFPDDSFEVVISNGVINLAADKRRVFAEAARVPRPGGRFGHRRHRCRKAAIAPHGRGS